MQDRGPAGRPLTVPTAEDCPRPPSPVPSDDPAPLRGSSALASSHVLPPGQHRVDTLRRFGTHLHEPPPAVPTRASLEVSAPERAKVELAEADLQKLAQVTMKADFHCVAGWSVVDLEWKGIPSRCSTAR